MKKIYYLCLIITIVLFSSCGSLTNKDECLLNVKKMFPNSNIYAPHNGSNTIFVVSDSSGMYIVETLNVFSSKVTGVKALHKW